MCPAPLQVFLLHDTVEYITLFDIILLPQRPILKSRDGQTLGFEIPAVVGMFDGRFDVKLYGHYSHACDVRGTCASSVVCRHILIGNYDCVVFRPKKAYDSIRLPIRRNSATGVDYAGAYLYTTRITVDVGPASNMILICKPILL